MLHRKVNKDRRVTFFLCVRRGQSMMDLGSDGIKLLVLHANTTRNKGLSPLSRPTLLATRNVPSFPSCPTNDRRP